MTCPSSGQVHEEAQALAGKFTLLKSQPLQENLTPTLSLKYPKNSKATWFSLLLLAYFWIEFEIFSGNPLATYMWLINIILHLPVSVSFVLTPIHFWESLCPEGDAWCPSKIEDITSSILQSNDKNLTWDEHQLCLHTTYPVLLFWKRHFDFPWESFLLILQPCIWGGAKP